MLLSGDYDAMIWATNKRNVLIKCEIDIENVSHWS